MQPNAHNTASQEHWNNFEVGSVKLLLPLGYRITMRVETVTPGTIEINLLQLVCQ